MDATKILIIEDDITLNKQIAALLKDRGFDVHQCHDGNQGLVTALRERFDLILLDVLLPNLNGFSLLSQLRKRKQTPVIMVTACGAEQERIKGYSNGADDYMPKPFSFVEMMLRIEALLRRSLNVKSNEVTRNSIVVDEITLDRRNLKANFAGKALDLTSTQFKLLWVLLENQNEVLSKPLLYQTVLERSFSRYDRSLDMHMSRVRKKLIEAGMSPTRLATQHGKGYLFS
ncbi:response regulator transcription factor [Alteromonas macleodii]|jgi:two-component system response regulator PfeR|uniref:Transcriptional regulatory, C terminal family protein n=2 Tax=Alteromonas macleodii TaxID=28108 RepID=A0AB36FV90_ALTMA|nr:MULTISPECIES: response regulator transcription factor [Alteromonas]MDY6976931.1 response regulator transcription factor [Pseudomonadota bacterium]AFS37483.1 two component transcriptional regulator, winged helix family protein [Alteromonas macleodii ATCC 27126]AFT74695.1 two component transcriptional regulator, winged helix family protein [Alteromonas macleodii str. 'English Channel 673']AUI82637.1 DNA-binding response regulator [Alteromonas macleodii]MBL3809515.1 response regulator transcri|tara:strand:- start:78 stop:767 length:690 start_codon:yes stop_codon:yes gene_type:complete